MQVDLRRGCAHSLVVVVAVVGAMAAGCTQFTQGLAVFPFVAAFDGAGNPNAAYGDGGVVIGGGIGGVYSIAAAPDGTVVAAGNPFGLVRLDPSGMRDLEYTARSAVTNQNLALALAPDESLFDAGGTFVPDEPRRLNCENASGGVCLRFAPSVTRLTADGTPDARFGDTGLVVTDTAPPNGAQGTAYAALALTPTDRITVAAPCAAHRSCATSSSRATATSRHDTKRNPHALRSLSRLHTLRHGRDRELRRRRLG